MRDLLGDDAGVQGIDVFVLGSHVHSRDANTVHFAIVELDSLLCFRPEVVVEKSDGQEVGSLGALERGAHLDHPVDHLRAVVIADLVRRKR